MRPRALRGAAARRRRRGPRRGARRRRRQIRPRLLEEVRGEGDGAREGVRGVLLGHGDLLLVARAVARGTGGRHGGVVKGRSAAGHAVRTANSGGARRRRGSAGVQPRLGRGELLGGVRRAGVLLGQGAEPRQPEPRQPGPGLLLAHLARRRRAGGGEHVGVRRRGRQAHRRPLPPRPRRTPDRRQGGPRRALPGLLRAPRHRRRALPAARRRAGLALRPQARLRADVHPRLRPPRFEVWARRSSREARERRRADLSSCASACACPCMCVCVLPTMPARPQPPPSHLVSSRSIASSKSAERALLADRVRGISRREARRNWCRGAGGRGRLAHVQMDGPLLRRAFS
mmetsp:Transcript_12533/g.35948  ORF Transcript_12533/g.35948 Transcript_12533/m.35948 type:complete len:345 (-) Transcript_12533:44-1078(-)